MNTTTPTPTRSGPVRVGPIRIGLVGCGNVSRRYLAHIAGYDALTVVACADEIPGNAASVGREFGIPHILGVDELLGHDAIDVVLNLTVPSAHAEVSLRALRGGKHVYTEKPLAADLEDARAIVTLAEELGLTVGCAPDTFMGAGITAVRQLIDDGAIGTPIAANAFMMNPGPELFHPGPEFLYRSGAGPLFDGGPYAVAALVALLGPIARVGALAATGRSERAILVGERAGTTFPVETPTHVAAVLQFAHGAVGSLISSFDVVESSAPRLEVHGTEGSIIAPAPNSWGGPVRLRRAGETSFSDIPIDDENAGFMGMGLVEMAESLALGRPARASGHRGLHTLEVLTGIHRSALDGGQFHDMSPVTDDLVPAPGKGNTL